MKWFVLVLSVLLSACSSTGQDLNKDMPKDDPYADSTLNSIKANQKIQIDQQMRKGY